MDDRRFDEIMTEYVESNKRDKEKILRKIREKEEQREKKSPGFSRFAIAACACALLAVITFSVVLPLSLGKKNRSGDQADDGGRVALDYQVAYANEDEDSSMDYSSSTREAAPNKHRNEKLIIRSYDEFRAADLYAFYYAGEIFFEENALIAVFTYGTEYSRSQLLGVYKENNKVILSVSKQKENVFVQTVETKCFASLPSLREYSARQTEIGVASAYVHILKVDKKQIQNVNTVEVEIEYSKQLIAFDDAVADGLITEEDTYNIRYNLQQEFNDYWEPNEDFTLPEDFEPAPKDPAELDDETKAAIRQAYVDSCNQWWIILNLDFDKRYKRHKGEIIYLGTYNGYVATTIRAEIIVFRVPSKEVEPIVFLCKVD